MLGTSSTGFCTCDASRPGYEGRPQRGFACQVLAEMPAHAEAKRGVSEASKGVAMLTMTPEQMQAHLHLEMCNLVVEQL